MVYNTLPTIVMTECATFLIRVCSRHVRSNNGRLFKWRLSPQKSSKILRRRLSLSSQPIHDTTDYTYAQISGKRNNFE